jgi:hypothetical protein
MAEPSSPPATRQRLPSWLDFRLVVGVLLLLGSAVVGARLIGAADRSVEVWAARAELAAGTTLRAEDVVVVRARLFDAAGRYLAAGQSPDGRTLNRDIGSGELLPRAALGRSPAGSLVSIPVGAQHAPESLRAGQRIDVYATPTGRSDARQTVRVLAAIPVQDVRRGGGGVLAGEPALVVVVRVPTEAAAAVVQALRTADIDITVVKDAATPPSGPSPDVRLPSDPSAPSGAPGEPDASASPSAPGAQPDGSEGSSTGAGVPGGGAASVEGRGRGNGAGGGQPTSTPRRPDEDASALIWSPA